MVIATPVLACIASLFAAVLPALRAASTRVAMQIKAAE
jgi:putative ABC transport system permease protein